MLKATSAPRRRADPGRRAGAAAAPRSAAGAGARRTPPATAPTKDAGNVPPRRASRRAEGASPPAPARARPPSRAGTTRPRGTARASGRSTRRFPGVETNRLIQGAGREWREFRNGPLTRYGGWLLRRRARGARSRSTSCGARSRCTASPPGRLIERFNARRARRPTGRWRSASCCWRSSGIVILWGKHIILPWLGYTGFSWLTVVSKNLHNFVGPLFIFSLVVMFLLFVKDNLPRGARHRVDQEVRRHVRKRAEVPSGKFNAGEKACSGRAGARARRRA